MKDNQKRNEDWFKKASEDQRKRKEPLRQNDRIFTSKEREKKESFSSGEGRGMSFHKGKEEETFFLRFVNWVIKTCIYLTVFLLPLFFWNNVPSPLELNKQIVLVSLIGIGFLLWVSKMAWRNEIKFRKSFVLIPMVTFLAVYGLSAFFSGYFDQSMWGYFGGESKSFITILFLVALFLLVFNNIKEKKDALKLLFVFLFGGFCMVLYGFLQMLGIHIIPMDGTEERAFNSVGSVYILGVYTAGLLITSLSLFLGDLSKIFKVILLSFSIFSFFVLSIISFSLIWFVLLIILSLILGVVVINGKNNAGRLAVMLFLIFTLVMILRGQPLMKPFDLPTEVSLNHQASVSIALSAIKSSPMLGSGPATFTNVYKINRPDNLGNFSSVNFEDSNSYFFTLASTIGLLGTLAYLFLVVTGVLFLGKSIVKIVSSAKQWDADNGNFENYLLIATGMTWFYVTLIQFFYFANMTTLFLWWLFFALFLSVYHIAGNKKENNEAVTSSKNPKTSFILSFGFVLVIIGFIASVYLHSQKYIAAAKFQSVLQESQSGAEPKDTAEELNKVVSLDPNKDIYYRNLAMANLAAARKTITEKGLQNLGPEDSNRVSSRFRAALDALNQAKNLDPKDSLNFAYIANLYKEFIVIQEDSGDKALENYRKAIELDPKNPDLYLGISRVYTTLADVAAQKQQASAGQGVQGGEAELPQESKEYLAMAEENLNKAIEVQPNHLSSHLLLVNVYQRYGKMDQAIEKAEQNIQQFPSVPENYLNLGSIYYDEERYEEARDILLQVVESNENYSNASYVLGLVYDKLGETEKSLEQFRKISELNQNDERVNQIIENLENGEEALSGLGQENQEALQPQVDEPAQEELPGTNESLTPEEGGEQITPQESEDRDPEEATGNEQEEENFEEEQDEEDFEEEQDEEIEDEDEDEDEE